MKLLPLYLLLLPAFAISQYKVTLILDSVPAKPVADKIYVSGNFNNWDPADPETELVKDANGKFTKIFTDASAVDYEYKFTLGSWQTVECAANGADIPNRKLTLHSDTVLHFAIAAWKKAPTEAPKHTTSKNVQVIDTAFAIPQLQRTRRIWVYLPADYNSSKKKFPVLYLHDGQNVFDAATSYAGEWGVDEALDSLSISDKPSIVVGIDNGGQHRMQEYNCSDNEKFGKEEGKAYLDFIVNTLKPYIDGHYRTLTDSKHTAIAGSSMGGLISFYALLNYPSTFGAGGIFSPSFWIIENKLPGSYAALKDKQLYFFYGALEGPPIVASTDKMMASLKGISGMQMKLAVDKQGNHNESTWRKAFPAFYKWWNK